MKEKKQLSRRDFLRLSSMAAVGVAVASCSPGSGNTNPPKETAPTMDAAAAEPITLSFTFWGSPAEKSAMEATVAKYMDVKPSTKITAQHIPQAYAEKVTTMIAGGTPPDVAYLGETFCEQLAKNEQLLDCGPYFKADPVMSTYMNNLNPFYGGILCGTGIANEFMVVFYDKRPFTKEGIEMPPSDPAKAWDIKKYTEVAKLLTKDDKGRNATDANFDKDNITTYGLNFPWYYVSPMTMAYSNGGKFTSDDGMELTLDTPEVIEAIQSLQDLVWKHHVTPTPSQLSDLSWSGPKLMDTGKIAMDLNGHWLFLEYPQTSVELGVAVFPYFKELISFYSCSPISIFKSTKFIEQSFDWYKFMHDPAQCDLYKEGLWAPVTSDYYEKPELTDAWLKGKPGVYPDEAKQVIVDYVYKYNSEKCYIYTTKNYDKIAVELVNPAFSAIGANEKTAEQALKEAVAKSAGYMEGKWPDIEY